MTFYGTIKIVIEPVQTKRPENYIGMIAPHFLTIGQEMILKNIKLN